MKILILVLSYDNPPYDALMRAQKATWASMKHPGVATAFYYGGLLEKDFEGKDFDLAAGLDNGGIIDIQLKCTDSYYYMADKFQRALEYVIDMRWDLIFRTNSSSYVNIDRLVEFAEKLPKEKCYAGWEIVGNDGYNIVSGAGIFMSRDVAEILMNEIDPKFEREEDVYIGQLLHEAGIPIIDDKSRLDYPFESDKMDEAYHFRLKTGDRFADAENMLSLHKQLHNL